MTNQASDERYLAHMRESVSDVEAYASGGRDQFFADRRTRDAVYWRLRTMAESSRRLSDDVRVRHADIPWRELHAFRNVMVHDFLTISARRIWDLIEGDLPKLKLQLAAITLP